MWLGFSEQKISVEEEKHAWLVLRYFTALLWNLLEALIQPWSPDTQGMLPGLYVMSFLYVEENSKPSLDNDFKELIWAIRDSIKDTNSQINMFLIQTY